MALSSKLRITREIAVESPNIRTGVITDVLRNRHSAALEPLRPRPRR